MAAPNTPANVLGATVKSKSYTGITPPNGVQVTACPQINTTVTASGPVLNATYLRDGSNALGPASPGQDYYLDQVYNAKDNTWPTISEQVLQAGP